jgi:MoaA/NifB/PqqE/SkfB family radical SAM enzyme
MRTSATHRRRGPYAELLRNFAVDAIALRSRGRRFLPLMTNFYVTKRCNLRCRFCWPPGDEPELETAAALTLLAKIRPRNPALNLTGGEPLLHPGLPEILERAHDLGFHPLLLSTNGLLIERVADRLALLDHLVISLDSTDESVGDAMTRVPGSTRRILAAIGRCAALARRDGFALSLHAVLAPETLGGLEDVLRLCEELGLSLSVSPEHGRFLPDARLRGDPAYRARVDDLIGWKRAGRPVAASLGYLRRIRDFTPHGCYPFLSPRVEPDGRVYFPCQRLRRRHAYLQDHDSLWAMMRAQAGWSDAAPECRERCWLACYLEVEQYLRNPAHLVAEAAMRGWVFAARRARGGAAAAPCEPPRVESLTEAAGRTAAKGGGEP